MSLRDETYLHFKYNPVKLFNLDNYIDFIDSNVQIGDNEYERIYKRLMENKETAMLSQYIKEKGFIEGIRKGRVEGSAVILSKFMTKKFHVNQDESFTRLKALAHEDIIDSCRPDHGMRFL